MDRHRTIMQRKTQDNHGEKDIGQSWTDTGQSWTDTGQPCKGGTIMKIMERQDDHGEKRHRTIMKRRQTEGNHTIFIRTDQLLVDEVVALVEDVLCARQHARLGPQLCQL